MDMPQSVTNMKIKDSVMPLNTTQPRGLIQNKMDDDDNVRVILYESEESESEEGDDPNLDCNDDDTDLAVACDDIPFGECCAGDDNEIFDSVWHDDMNGTGDNCGPGKRGQEVGKDKMRGYKIHRASLYTFRHKDGTFYHIQMRSELGGEYRKLATRDEKKAFILANGFPKGNLYEARARGKAQQEKKRLKELTGETQKGN